MKLNLDSKKLRLVLIAALALSVVVFIAILVMGLSALGTKSSQMVDLKVQSQTADAQLTNLEQAKKQVAKYSYFKEVAKTVIPSDKDQAAAVVEISRMADASGLGIQSITFPASTLGLTTSTTSTSSTTQDATSATSSTKAISQAKPVSGIAGLYSLELTITPLAGNNAPPDKQITYAKMLDFLSRIENNRHTAQISDLLITPSGSGNTVLGAGFGFVVSVNIFLKPS